VLPFLLVAALTVPASGSAPEVRVEPGAPLCGGMTLVATARHSSCVHPVADAFAPSSPAPPATAPVVCYGDGTTGPRVQLLYAYVAGQPNRAATVVQQLRREIAPRMQGMVSAASGGKDLGIRFAFQPGCSGLSVPVLRLPAGTLRGSDEEQFARVIGVLEDLGYTRTDRKYQVQVDGSTRDGVCGMGELGATFDQPHPANVHDGTPTVGSGTDLPSTLGAQDTLPLPRYSMVWRTTYGPRGPSCFELGQSRAETQMHELLHTLGAVQLSAPHSDGGGHCTDHPSVMCPRGKPVVKPCARQRVEPIDCGFDDYWNPDPPDGSYLATHDNIATSVFFGPQPQDRLGASPV
jgi:hypothetical protein